jgi:hypothetical protein
MAVTKFGNHLDMLGNQIRNVVLDRLDALPPASAANAGRVAYSNPDKKVVFSDGVSWLTLSAASVARSVRVASTANTALTTDTGDTIDGVVLAQNDRVLLKDQTDPIENGVYVVNALGTPLSRAADSDTAAEFPPGALVTATAGTANTGKTWINNAAAGYTMGTDPIPLAEVTGGGITYTAGQGITIAGTVISAKRFKAAVPDGAADTVITHNLNDTEPNVVVVEVATGDKVETGVTYTDANTLTLGFATAPTAGQYRVSVG